MNILVPYTWLLEHLDTNATPADIQRCLSLCGPSVERTYDREGESVFDIEVTTNRVDAASVRGIAREAAAILPEFGFKATLKPLPPITFEQNATDLDIKIVNDPRLCHRILAIKLSSIKPGPSPKWMQTRLEQIDLRPINNIVDITNYIMWDVGHPIHAFDYDRLTKKQIIVREAKKGETLKTLDDKIHTLKGGEVIFDDGTGTIIDLPGIMGTANTAITDSTKNVLLWIESVDAVKIRQASMGLAIRSQAAVLNEKRVDPELAKIALEQAINRYQTIAHAKIGSKIVDIYPHHQPPQTTTVTQDQINAYLGISIKPAQIHRILESLGCTLQASKQTYHITPPSTRMNDLLIPEDYIEEIARIYGYHNLPSTIMPTTIPHNPSPDNFSLEHQIKQWLVGWGAQEVYTYSMVSKAIALQSGHSLKNHVSIANPLSDEWVYLRRSLLPSLLEVAKNNPTRSTICIFEMQNVYHPQPDLLPTEQLHLSLLSNQPYPQMVGLLDALMDRLFITDISIVPQEIAPSPFQNAATILYKKQYLGDIGSINSHYFAFDLLVSSLQAHASTHPTILTLTNYPAIIEDLTFTLPEKIHLGPILTTVKHVDPLIESVTLKDIYNRNYTLTLTYRSPHQSLASNDVGPIRKQIVKTLAEKHQAILVGNLK